MIVIKPDFERRIELTGVAAPVPRPVDIDSSMTGFSSLRTLRIYQFAKGSVIDGHAEEDEVYIVLLSGQVDLTMTASDTTTISGALFPPLFPAGDGCAAYLPPQAAYKLVVQDDADVAYARAKPVDGRPPKIFAASTGSGAKGAQILLDEATYAEKLRLRLVLISSRRDGFSFPPSDGGNDASEMMMNIRTDRPGRGIEMSCQSQGAPVLLDSWDTVAAASGELFTCTIGEGAEGLLLIVADKR